MHPTHEQSAWPESTTLLAGACLSSAATIALVASTGWLDGLLLLLDEVGMSQALGLAVSVLTVVGFAVLAIGARGERGVAGASRLGKLGLLLYGGQGFLWDFLPSAREDSGPLAIVVTQISSAIVIVLVAAMLFLAAIEVFNANVLTGVARWLLMPIATANVFLSLLIALPGAHQVPALAAVDFATLVPLLTLLFAIGCLLHGRVEALKHRLRLA